MDLFQQFKQTKVLLEALQIEITKTSSMESAESFLPLPGERWVSHLHTILLLLCNRGARQMFCCLMRGGFA